ncbi:hypothetical protein [Aurantiacibacter rhizosphaerae]|uniref:Lipoprotein n=1 Tax=Aurantiacibacter rhizosphaerae TaxID=2691582 RepID=A0A844X9K8_9SPHN|nr:hypothetical protein [Aurantiacibacter rhizosphaerae]MWV26636.1 hypothetical protein [Aurantiacibacter rhizosphaerae]
MKTSLLAFALAAPLLTACATMPQAPALPASQEAFWDNLSSHCGNTYRGALASSDERDADFAGLAMLAHWAECSDTRIAIAFHVESGMANTMDDPIWDRSRTWVVTRTADGLRLKHDHRHEDGSEDVVTQYGGDTLSTGTARVQDFPVDAYSRLMFEREGLDVSLTNVWRMEVTPADAPGAMFAYQLTRRNDPTRLFRVEFDAGNPVDESPGAWGW